MSQLAYDPSNLSLILPFEGCHNFRAISGWTTPDGRRLAEGRLFRSDGLDQLTGADHNRLPPLGIAQVFDLRASAEIERAPSRWPDGFLPEIWTGAECAAEADLSRMMSQDGLGSADFTSAMRGVYATFPDTLAAALRALAGAIIQSGGGPILIHCTAGKDRTGFIVAMLLHATGIRRDEVMADYLLTNAVYSAAHTRFNSDGRLDAVEARSPGSVVKLLGAFPEYLAAAERRMVEQSGSLDRWLEQCAGLDGQARRALGSILLL